MPVNAGKKIQTLTQRKQPKRIPLQLRSTMSKFINQKKEIAERNCLRHKLGRRPMDIQTEEIYQQLNITKPGDLARLRTENFFTVKVEVENQAQID